MTAYLLGTRSTPTISLPIDNKTTRKLVTENKRPLSVGSWFSLGHSSIVFGLCVLLTLGVRALAGQVTNDNSNLQQVTGLVGTSVSGLFLIALGIVNLVSLVALTREWRRMRTGEFDEAQLEHHLEHRGMMNRLLRPIMKSVLFAAGMTLLDSIDGLFMNFAYSWAFSRPVRKVYYNLNITGLSVAVALIIGTIEIISIVVDKLAIRSGPLHTVGTLDLNDVGFLIVALFAATWTAALVWWKTGHVEEKWNAGLSKSESLSR